jgi:hypothetical protein
MRMATRRDMSCTRTTIEQAEAEKEVLALYSFFSCASPSAVSSVDISPISKRHTSPLALFRFLVGLQQATRVKTLLSSFEYTRVI